MAVHSADILERSPILPPGFTGVALDRPGAALGHAASIAAEAGAATLVHVRRADMVEFAVVLEPEEPLSLARHAHYLGMNALADALASHCPPEMGIAFRWPDALLFDGGLIGGGRLLAPVGAAEDAVPEWLVFGGMVRISARLDYELDATRRSVAMDETGFETLDPVELIESFAHHLMLGVSEWQALGVKSVASRWLERIERIEGVRHAISPDGDLLVGRDGERERRALVAALELASWYDPAHAEPKL
jgi:biotin-(acetyl-CoA carboxylase) ligase